MSRLRHVGHRWHGLAADQVADQVVRQVAAIFFRHATFLRVDEEGTEAAGEILYNPVYLNSLLAKAPVNWEKMNMEAVIETQVIEGHSGPPNVLAVETW